MARAWHYPLEDSMADSLEVQFNALLKGVTQAGVIPSRLDWFKAGYHHANDAAVDRLRERPRAGLLDRLARVQQCWRATAER
jgi:hypothetical protein